MFTPNSTDFNISKFALLKGDLNVPRHVNAATNTSLVPEKEANFQKFLPPNRVILKPQRRVNNECMKVISNIDWQS